jgi:protein phosphatase
MLVKSAGKSHTGMKRKINEDSFFISSDIGLYVIADGMGGHKAGDVASRLVVDTLEDYWEKVINDKPPSFLGSIEQDVSKGAKHLINSILLANAMIHEAQKKPEYRRMGSTVSALLVEKDRIWAANVGDSSIYHFDHGRLTQVSEEHSLEAERKSMGLVEPYDSTSPVLKNMLTRVLGQSDKVEVYITTVRPVVGNTILLCSDGLTNYLSEESIYTILDDFSVSIERKVDILIDEANWGGGGDNISVILLEVLDEGKWKKLKKRFKLRD